MISFIFKTLQSFRFLFSRTTTWLMFCAVVIGFIGATDMIGISSFCRFYSVLVSHKFLIEMCMTIPEF